MCVYIYIYIYAQIQRGETLRAPSLDETCRQGSLKVTTSRFSFHHVTCTSRRLCLPPAPFSARLSRTMV